MSRKNAPFIDIVRLEDKETKLKAFVRTVIENSAARSGAESGNHPIMLIARSIESPSAKAIAALVREGVITSPVRTILALLPRSDADAEEAAAAIAALAGSNGGRIIRDVRLYDAHEQIVLGSVSSWIGDCMRRDPMKRDAYECFAADCSKTAGWARISFERLWQSCEPMTEDVLATASGAAADVCLPAVSGDDATADPLATRTR